MWWARLPVTRRLLRRIGDSVDTMTYVSEWCRERIAPALSADAAGPDGPAVAGRRPGPVPSRAAEERRPGVRLGLAPTAPVVVCTARLVRRKGQDTLVAAWPEVLATYPDAVLLLVGDGPDRRRLRSRRARLGRGRGSVVLTGSVDWREVPAYVDAGDVFAMPCRTRRWGLEPEAWGIVLLEAQACGLPVLVGRSGGAPETLGAGEPQRAGRRRRRRWPARWSSSSRSGEPAGASPDHRSGPGRLAVGPARGAAQAPSSSSSSPERTAFMMASARFEAPSFS